MAFPNPLISQGVAETSSDLNCDITVPAASLGDLILFLFCQDGNTSATWPATPSLTQIVTRASNGTAMSGEVKGFKVTDTSAAYSVSGTVGAGGVHRVTFGANEAGTCTIVRVPAAEWSQDIADVFSVAFANVDTANPNPPRLPAAGDLAPGALDYAWIAICMYDLGTVTVTGYPTNYADDQTNHRGSAAGGVGIGLASQGLNAASEDPGTFTLSASEDTLATTIAIRPASGTPTVAANAIVSAEAVSTAFVRRRGYVAALASAEALGQPFVRRLGYLSGIASGEAFGVPRLAAIVRAIALASAETFGSHIVLGPVYLTTNSVPSAEAFGATRVARVIYGTALDSLEALGLPTVRRRVEDGTIASAESVSAASAARIVRAHGIASGEAFGQPRVSSDVFVYVTGIGSGEAFGTPLVLGPIRLHPSGIPSGEAFGVPAVEGGIVAAPAPAGGGHRQRGRSLWDDYVPPLQVQEPEEEPVPYRPPARTLGVTAIPSTEAFGLPTVRTKPPRRVPVSAEVAAQTAADRQRALNDEAELLVLAAFL